MSIKEEYTAIDMATAAADGFRDGQRAAQSAPVGERDDEREAFEAVVRLNWASAPLHYVRDALPKDDPRYGQYVDETLQGMWVGWQGRAAWQRTQSAGVPEALREAVEYLDDNPFNEIGAGSILHRAMRDALAAEPKAPEGRERPRYVCRKCKQETRPPEPYKAYVLCDCGYMTSATTALSAAPAQPAAHDRVRAALSPENQRVVPVEPLLANPHPLAAAQGEFGDAYQGAREDLAIWKRRALEAEARVRQQDQIIDQMGEDLNAINGPTFMGEPVIPAALAQGEARRLREALTWLRGAINCTAENDVDQCGAWISTKHPMIQRIDELLAASTGQEVEK